MQTAVQSEPAVSIAQLTAEAAAALDAAGVPTPRLDAEVLLAAASGLERAGLYARYHEAVPPECRAAFSAMLSRRLAREPLPYIIGTQEFWSLDFIVTPSVLIPRPETERVVELAIRFACGFPLPLGEGFARQSARSLDTAREKIAPTRDERKSASKSTSDPFPPSSRLPLAAYRGAHRQLPGKALGEGGGEGKNGTPAQASSGGARRCALTICDVGTGSGCIAVALARELPQAKIFAADVSASALAVAQANARRHGVDGRIRFLASDLFVGLGQARFDLIVCNPPYVCSNELPQLQPEVTWEPRLALDGGARGLDIVARVLSAGPDRLTDDGSLLMEIGAEQGPAAETLARARGFTRISTVCDYAGLPRVLVAGW